MLLIKVFLIKMRIFDRALNTPWLRVKGGWGKSARKPEALILSEILLNVNSFKGNVSTN